MKKKVTLTFDLDIEEQKKAYEYLKNKGRNKSKDIVELIINKDKQGSNIDYSSLKEQLICDTEFIERIRKCLSEEDDVNSDDDFILNGLNGFL